MVVSEKLIKNDFYIDRYSKLLYELGIDFKNIEFYIQAFIHRSIINEKPDIGEHNERLEFL
jgi:dsRNA-specific ribonuclease